MSSSIQCGQDQNGSYDFVDNDNNVAPGYSQGERDNHGTSCAGEIAMAKDNSICGVGVAYEAKIAGVFVFVFVFVCVCVSLQSHNQ